MTFLLLGIGAPQGAAQLVCSLPMKSGKSLAGDITDTCAMHADLVTGDKYRLSDKKNGSVHGHVLRAFKHHCLTN